MKGLLGRKGTAAADGTELKILMRGLHKNFGKNKVLRGVDLGRPHSTFRHDAEESLRNYSVKVQRTYVLITGTADLVRQFQVFA